MKRLGIAIVVLLTSCLEQVDLEQSTFVKVIGKEGSSTGGVILELNNGDLMILGELGVAAHEPNTNGDFFDIDALEDQAPFIAITDPNGNLKLSRSYPIEDLELPFGEVLNAPDKSRFTHVVQYPDGSFTILGQFRDVDVVFNGITFESDPTRQIENPFILDLDPELNVVNYHWLNAEVFDSVGYFRPRIKMMENGVACIMIGIKFRIQDDPGAPLGFDFLTKQAGSSPGKIGAIGVSGFLKHAYDFDLTSDNNLVILGQTDDYISGHRVPFSDVRDAQEEIFRIDDDGVSFGMNSNTHFISYLEEDGGYAITYTDAPSKVIFRYLNSDFSYDGGEINLGNLDKLTGPVRSPRAMARAANGDFLVLTIEIGNNTNSTLFRVNRAGVVFQRPIDGVPGSVIEASDGGIVVTTNPIYNGQLPKIKLQKLDANGRL